MTQYSAASLRWARELADLPYWQADRLEALAQIDTVRTGSAARPVTSGMNDHELCALAERRAELMADHIGRMDEPTSDEAMRAALSALAQRLDARPLPEFHQHAHPADQLAGMIRRLTCRLWWRRQLRRACVRLIEVEALAAGTVSARARQVYCTDDTVSRYVAAAERARAMLEATEIEAEDGEIINLWDAFEASTANKAVRRAELMTRIRGCEEWADAAGLVGIFTTNTAPSRFHAQVKATGRRNERHDGSTPREAQRWLSQTWARTRAALQRAKVQVFGFRVAEPHHDGCPHWHMLLWCLPEHVEKAAAIMRAQWLRPESRWRCIGHAHKHSTAHRFLFTDLGELEPGASEHRFKWKRLERGGAAGYVAKYVAKNIDDAGAVGDQGHFDEIEGQQVRVDGGAVRVVAWASAWGIRQFQAIGQPPVTVWRELRRVETVAGATERVQAAHAAVHRGERRACWRSYMLAQGGAMCGRNYLIRMARREGEREGRYETVQDVRPLGVFDVERADQLIPSSRREWKPRGEWARPAPAPQRPAEFRINGWGEIVPNVAHAAWVREQQQAPQPPRLKWQRDAQRGVLAQRPQAASTPRTRFNNCTRAGGPELLMSSGIVAASTDYREPGGFEDAESWPTPPPTPPRPSPNELPRWR